MRDTLIMIIRENSEPKEASKHRDDILGLETSSTTPSRGGPGVYISQGFEAQASVFQARKRAKKQGYSAHAALLLSLYVATLFNTVIREDIYGHDLLDMKLFPDEIGYEFLHSVALLCDV